MSEDRRGRRFTRAVALASVLGISACGGPDSPSPSPLPTAAAADAACATVRVAMPCHALAVDGRTQRYAVVPGEGATASEIVIVDLGGPGRSLFGSDELIALAALWGTQRTLVFLEEPWPTGDLTPDCRDALSRTYVAWKAGAPGPDDLASSCPGEWGWDAAHYTTAAQAVVDAVSAGGPDAHVVGTVGISQGSERTSWLWATIEPEWAVIVSPPPRIGSAEDYLERRAEAVLASWIDQCRGCEDAAGVDSFAADAMSRWAAAPVEIDSRSVPVDGFDAIAAMVAASYGPGRARRSLATALDAPSPEAARDVGALSDALLMRYGVTDMAAGQLAYFGELCPAYPGWPVADRPANEVAAFFATVHEPCAQFAGAAAETPRDAPQAPAEMCVASTSDDGVTGREAADEWAAFLGPGTVRVDTTGGQHGALDLATGCASALGVGGS